MSEINDLARRTIRKLMHDKNETVRSLASKSGHSANWLQKRLSGITEWSIDDVALVGEQFGILDKVFVQQLIIEWNTGNPTDWEHFMTEYPPVPNTQEADDTETRLRPPEDAGSTHSGSGHTS